MSVLAPLCVPVELRRESGSRWFRLAEAVSEHGLIFPRPLPREIEGPLVITFQLPPPGGDVCAGMAQRAGPARVHRSCALLSCSRS